MPPDALRSRFATADKPADEFLNVLGHIADFALLGGDGSHIGALRLDGKALSLLDEGGRYAERRRIEAVLRALADTNVAVCTYHVSHDRVPGFDCGRFRSAFARDLVEAYHRHLAPQLRARDWYVFVVVRPRPLGSFLNRFRGTPPGRDDVLLRQLRERLLTVRAILKDYGPVPLGLRRQGGAAFSEIGEALRLILYGRWAPVPLTRGPLTGAIYTERVICGTRGFEILTPGGSSYGVIWGLRDYPEVTKPWMLDGLLSATCRLVMTNSFFFRTATAAADRMALTQRRMQSANDRAVSLVGGLDAAIDDVQSGRKIMGDHHWSLAVHADTLEELEAAAGEIRRILADGSNLAAVPEALGCFPAFWAQVPGCSSAVRARHGDISGFNFVSFSSLSGFPRGGGRMRWGRAPIRLITAGHTAHDFNPHVQQVGQILVIGRPGGGKSVIIGTLCAALEPCFEDRGGGIAVILDKDGSNELTVRARGGSYAQIRAGVASGMAPLKALSDTGAARTWLAEFVRGLILADGKAEPPPDQLERIRTGIAFLLRQPPRLRWLGGLRQFLDHGTEGTGARLERWCRGGALGWAFDGEADLIRFDAGVVGIDNTEILADEQATVRAPAAAYQLFRIREQVGRGTRSAVFIDEGASYLPDGRFSEGFDAFSREFRKGNALLCLVVHHPQDLTRHPVGRTLIGNFPTQLLFPNPDADEAAYREALHCTPGEIRAVMQDMTALGAGTFLVKRAEGSFIARMPLGEMPEHLAVLSADPNRRALWHRIARDLGSDDPDRIWAVFRTRYQEAEA